MVLQASPFPVARRCCAAKHVNSGAGAAAAWLQRGTCCCESGRAVLERY